MRQTAPMNRNVAPIDAQSEGLAVKRNLTQNMLDSLGKAIVTGRYDQRPFPTEVEIEHAFGVSRSVTREALKMLAAKGLVAARPRQGTWVQPFQSWNLFDPDVLRWLLDRKLSIELLINFTQLRRGIEPEAAALAARRKDDVALAAIWHELDRMRRAERGEDDPLAADIGFHLAILQASGNPFYLQFRGVISTALKTSIHFTNRIKGHTASVAEHEAVAAAISAGDVDQARAFSALLIDNVLELIDSR